tara:strand:- start:7819 stop:9198 length:1380 start_codon:yes stop_codon:yes gene_type:complete
LFSPSAPFHDPAMSFSALIHRTVTGQARNGLYATCLACCFLIWRSESRADSLPVDGQIVIDTVASSDLFSAEGFVEIDDPYIGPVVVGQSDTGSAISVILIPGDQGLDQVQIIMTQPWSDLAARVELVASLASLMIGPPPVFTEPLAEDETLASLSPMAKWVYGLMTEAWLGWPGSEQRLVRVRDGVSFAVEGVPPDIWGITITPDWGYGDQTWPGPYVELDPPGVTEARMLIREGRYDEVEAVLLPLAEAEVPQAAKLMGDMYRFGRLAIPNQQTAADWYLIGGRFKEPASIWSLAAMGSEGWGVFFVSNFKAPLIVRASEAGSADAMFVLAGTNASVNYVRPEGVTVFDQTIDAARWGLLGAQQDIALLYATGDGVEGDPVEAYAWALVALSNTGPGLDYIRSHQFAQDLRKGLSDDQIAEAEERSIVIAPGPPAWPPAGVNVPALDIEASEQAPEP